MRHKILTSVVIGELKQADILADGFSSFNHLSVEDVSAFLNVFHNRFYSEMRVIDALIKQFRRQDVYGALVNAAVLLLNIGAGLHFRLVVFSVFPTEDGFSMTSKLFVAGVIFDVEQVVYL